MPYKQFEIKDRPKDWDEFTDAAAEAHSMMNKSLLGLGMEASDVGIFSENIANFAKWFAANYARLLIEGKVPEDKEYRSKDSGK